MTFLHSVRKNRFVTGVVLAAGVVSVFWILWFIGATRYQSAIDGWIEQGKAAGYDIAYDRREEFGFPQRTVLRFINLRWKNTDGVAFHAGDIDITAPLWQTQTFTAKFKGQIELDVPVKDEHYTLTLAGESGDAAVTLSKDGIWSSCELVMKAARLGRAPDYVVLAEALKLSAKRPQQPPATMKEAGLILSVDAANLTLPATLPESFGNHLSHLQSDLRVMGATPDFRVKDSVDAWNKKFGVVHFDRLDMEWGDLLLASKGTMGFDDDLQPEGAFDGVVGHQDKVLQALAKAGFIAVTQQSMLHSALSLFAKPAPIGDTQGVEVPVAVQLGGFYLGPVKIFAFPPIEWE